MASNIINRLKRVDTTVGSVSQKLLMFAGPILFSNLVQQIYTSTDLIILGNFGNDTAVAALGSTTSMINLILSIFTGLSLGASVSVSQAIGADDRAKTYKAVHSTIALSLIIGIILTIFGLFFSGNLLNLVNVPQALMPEATTYLRIIFIGMIPQGIFLMGTAILRAAGDSTRPMVFLFISAIVTLTMDVILIGFLNLSIVGAGFATISAQFVSAILVLRTLIKSDAPYQLHVQDIKLDKEATAELFRIGLPATIQSIFISGANTSVSAQINKFGVNAVEGYAAASRLDTMHYLLINGFSLAATTVVGQNMGARKPDRVKEGMKISLLFAVFGSLALGVFMVLFRRPLLSMFNIAEASYAYAEFSMILNAFTYWLFAFGDVFSGAFRAAGKAIFPMISSFINMFIIRVGFASIAQAMTGDYRVVLWVYPVSWLSQAIFMLVYYFRGKWLVTDTDVEEKPAEEIATTNVYVDTAVLSDEAAGEFLPNYLELETVVASHEIEDMKENTTDDLVVENEEDLASIDGIESNHYQEPKVFVSDSVNADIYR